MYLFFNDSVVKWFCHAYSLCLRSYGNDLQIRILVVVLLFMSGQSVAAGEICVAVAGNFRDAARVITKRFEKETGHRVILTFGSTGKHYAQIRNGAPFDIFLAADIRRPELLEKEGYVLEGSRFTYAMGRVVLWSPRSTCVDSEGKILERHPFRYLAMPNPKLAPYGDAAREILQARGVWDDLQSNLVRGESVNQTFQFVKSGNAEVGFVAWSQIKQPDQAIKGSYWLVPQALYTPIEQQAVLLKESDTARDFLAYLRSAKARKMMHEYGYKTP